MKSRKTLILVCVVFGAALFGVYWVCPFPGCYGPFEIVVKSEKGERVEDIIVSISQFETGIGGLLTPRYGATVLGNTDEILSFPRGYVYRDDSDELSLYFNVSHPDYQSLYLYTRGKKGLGTIRLETKTIVNNQDLRDRNNLEKVEIWRKEGLDEEEIEKRLEGKGIVTPVTRLSPAYFARLLNMGRQDVVDKYLSKYLNEYYNYKNLSSDEAAKFEAKFMKNIRKYRR
jgi:hypothetical protein